MQEKKFETNEKFVEIQNLAFTKEEVHSKIVFGPIRINTFNQGVYIKKAFHFIILGLFGGNSSFMADIVL